MPFNIPTGGFGGMEIGSIYAKVGADLSDFDRGMARAALTMRETARSMNTSGDSIGSDAEKAGRRVNAGMKDGEKGLSIFDKAARDVGRSMNGGPFGLVGALGAGVSAAFKLGGATASVVTTIAGLGQVTEQAALGTEQLGTTALQTVDTIEQMGGAAAQSEGAMASFAGTAAAAANPIGLVVTGVTLLVGALFLMPAAAGAATFVMTALLEVATTLTAVVAGFVAPLTLVTGLLAALGAGFGFAAVTAMKGNGPFAALANKVHDLGGEFHGLGRALAHDFLPYFWDLANAAQTALNYLSKVAKMPLNEAFKSLSTQGVHLLSKFLYGVGHALAKPFRLAIQLAFNSGSGMKNTVQSWWDSFTHYLFGYVKTKRIELRPGKFGFTKQTVDGALKPIMDWFGRQHFEKTGRDWADKIMSALKSSGLDKKLEDFIGPIATSAGSKAGAAFEAAFMAQLVSLPWQIGAAISGAQGPALTVDKHGGVHNPQGIPVGPIGRGGAMTGHAAGGIIMRPLVQGRHLFGEAGPEAVIPLTGSRARGLLGGGGHTTIINVHVAGTVVTERKLIDSVRSALIRHDTANGTIGGRPVSSVNRLIMGSAARLA